jgi:ATP-binding cassette, subfamily B, multidrug efflux pump
VDNSARPASLAFLRPYASTYARPFVFALLCLAAEASCDLLQPTIMARVIDQGVAAGDIRRVLSLGGLMLAVTALGAIAAVGRNFLSNIVSQRFGAELRSDAYRRILGLRFGDLDRFGTGALVTRLTNDVTQVQTFVNGTMRIFVKAPLLAIGGIVMAVVLDARMAPILLAVVPLVALLILLNVRTGYPFYRRIQAALDRVNSVIGEYLAGVRVVKAYDRFEDESARFEAESGELARTTSSAMRVMALFSPLIAFAVNLGIVAVLWFGGLGVGRGDMKVGQVIAFVNYMIQILSSLMMISWIFTMFARARASTERLAEIFALPPPAGGGAGPREAASLNASKAGAGRLAARGPGSSVEFDDVSFSYPGSPEPSLRRVSFSCPSGARLGIIGSTGSGKTSLLGLLLRFYEPDSGRVLVGGEEASRIEESSLRSRVALVPQRSLLFGGSVLDNIRWGREDASLAEVEAAARMAQAHEFIAELPQGYHTRLDRGGVGLSGGQRQRIAIARALVRRAPILVLDDSMSALDAVTESRLRAALDAGRGGSTLVLVAQRISSVRDADRILVLDEGAVAGFGSHEELLESCEVYRDIGRSQLGPESLRGGDHGRA